MNTKVYFFVWYEWLVFSAVVPAVSSVDETFAWMHMAVDFTIIHCKWIFYIK